MKPLKGGNMMKIYNYSKLLGLMKEKGYTQASLADKINISECSMNLSLNNKRNFRQDEISNICTILNIENSKIEEYFFASNI